MPSKHIGVPYHPRPFNDTNLLAVACVCPPDLTYGCTCLDEDRGGLTTEQRQTEIGLLMEKVFTGTVCMCQGLGGCNGNDTIGGTDVVPSAFNPIVGILLPLQTIVVAVGIILYCIEFIFDKHF